MSCAFLYDDKSRTAAVTSSGTLGDGGVDRLADPQPRHRMRLAGTAVQFTMDLGSVVSLDVLALISTTLTADGDARVRASASDPTATGSLVHDSGVIAGVTDAKWLGQVVQVLTVPVSARYVRWDLNMPSGASIDVGLAPLGLLWRPTRNYAYGAQKGRQDYGIRDGSSRTGAMFAVEGSQARVQAFSLASLSPAEVEADVTEMDLRAGVARDVLWVPEATDAILARARNCIWGPFRQVGTPQLATHESFQLMTRSYQMTERL